mmetsp:Transcript_81709/g.236908  ORF Transcript_81709/g.236908 Transcript_81709/m.236908 type:complete len:103 (+) Transcript_81709:110-418(+)
MLEMRQFSLNENVAFTICRPHLFVVKVPKQGRQLGLEVKFDGEGSSLCVSGVQSDGAAEIVRSGIRANDRIVAVNGVTGSTRQLLMELGTSDVLTMTISRCP